MDPRRLLLILGLLTTTLALAGCGTPDEQEGDENAASEQESVGEGEVPGPGLLAGLAAVGIALTVLALRRR